MTVLYAVSLQASGYTSFALYFLTQYWLERSYHTWSGPLKYGAKLLFISGLWSLSGFVFRGVVYGYEPFRSEIVFIICKGEAVPMKLMKCCKEVLKGETVAVFFLWS